MLLYLIKKPIMAFFRPGKDAPKRKLFNWLHRIVGLAAFSLSIATLFLGSKIFFHDKYSLILLFVFLGWVFLVPIILEMFQYCSKNENKQFGCDPNNLKSEPVNVNNDISPISKVNNFKTKNLSFD